mgnify:CR=1 FL=1
MKDFNALAEARLERLEEDVHFLIVLMLSVCGLLSAIGNLKRHKMEN